MTEEGVQKIRITQQCKEMYQKGEDMGNKIEIIGFSKNIG